MSESFAKSAIFSVVSAICLFTKAEVLPPEDYLTVELSSKTVAFAVKESVNTESGAFFHVDSGSPLTSLTVSGLPSGVKYDKTRGAFCSPRSAYYSASDARLFT